MRADALAWRVVPPIRPLPDLDLMFAPVNFTCPMKTQPVYRRCGFVE